MKNSNKINDNKHLAPPPEAVISHGRGFLWHHAQGKLRHPELVSGFPEWFSNNRHRAITQEMPKQVRHDVSGGDVKKAAFTLAETLITLMVIGVVAALTIPALMQQIGDYTLEKQRDVFSKKFAEGLRQMRVDEKLSENTQRQPIL